MSAKSVIDELNRRLNTITKLIDAAEKKINKFPPGRLKIKNTNSPYYYILDDDGTNERLLKKDELVTAQQLAQKAYCQRVIKNAKEEQKILEKALHDYPAVPVEKIYECLPQNRQELIKPIITPDDEFIKQWNDQPYTPKPFAEGTPYYETLKGERVRSKSEQIIADRLTAAAVPYKYECPLKLGNQLFHPDFKILRISDRKEIYYEHFGKADDPVYMNNNMLPRYNVYQQNNIILGDNFFATFESSEHPLDVRVLDKLIEDHFR